MKFEQHSRVLFCLKSTLALICATFAFQAEAEPNLDGMIPILNEDFGEGLNRYDGQSGLWSTLPRRKQLMTNAAETVFLDQHVLGDEVAKLVPPLHEVTPDGLALRTAKIPDALKPTVRQYMSATKQGKRASQVRFATGEITTAHTWAQTYGYFEIEARIPRGRGRWPAFWMTFAGLGWPPEIDVMEAFGAGFAQRTKKDHTFNTAVYFDAYDSDQLPSHSVDIENPYAETGAEQPKSKKRGQRQVYNFQELQTPQMDFSADIYDNFHTYAALWTAEHVIFYFGKDRASLREIYRTPTPEDVNVPMFLIANDQFTARGGWWPANDKTLDQVLAPDNAFVIKNITVRAFKPTKELYIAQGDKTFATQDSHIFDSQGDDHIHPGPGFDLISLSSGADVIHLQRDRSNKIIEGFGADDSVVLDGYPFADAEDVMARLTNVGDDVWLPSGGDPGWPHTIIFRDTRITDFQSEQFNVKWPVALNIWRADAGRPDKAEIDSDNDGILKSDWEGAWLNDKGRPVQMVGTVQSDRFLIANKRSTLSKEVTGGIDVVMTWVDLALPDHITHGIAHGKGTYLKGTAGDDRLETDATASKLQGAAGNDLYVLGPNAKSAAIFINLGDGYDQIRGFNNNGHSLVFDHHLRLRKSSWTFEPQPNGIKIMLSEEQSLLIEGHTQDSLASLLNM